MWRNRKFYQFTNNCCERHSNSTPTITSNLNFESIFPFLLVRNGPITNQKSMKFFIFHQQKLCIETNSRCIQREQNAWISRKCSETISICSWQFGNIEATGEFWNWFVYQLNRRIIDLNYAFVLPGDHRWPIFNRQISYRTSAEISFN